MSIQTHGSSATSNIYRANVTRASKAQDHANVTSASKLKFIKHIDDNIMDEVVIYVFAGLALCFATSFDIRLERRRREGKFYSYRLDG
jgi:hypothetical protein